MLRLLSPTRSLARLVLATSVAATGVGVTLLAAPTPSYAAASAASIESQFVSLMNSAREQHGLRPYAVNSTLTSIARSHSRDMAARQSLYHNPDLQSQVPDWQSVGENVGEGPDAPTIHDAFMGDAGHRDNILDPSFTQVGVGVAVDSNGEVWVTEDFRQPEGTPNDTGRSAPAPTTTTRRTTSTTTTHRTATRTVTRTATTSRPVATVSRSVTAAPSHPAAPSHTAASTPRPAAHPTPAATLAARLTSLSAPAAGSDPVTQAYAFADTLNALTQP